jgi:outer membrane protein TolC
MTRNICCGLPCRMCRRFAASWALLSVVMVAGCTTPPYRDSGPVPMTNAPGQAVAAFPMAAARPPETRLWSPTVEEAVQCALACNSEINALQAAVFVADRRRQAATDITDPELKLAWGQSNGDSSGSRWNTRDTESQSTSEQTSQRSRTEAGTTVASDGSPLSSSSGSQTTTERSQSTSRGTETRTTRTSGSSSDSGLGWRIDARFFVPNPWLLFPRVDARKAEIQATQADLRAAIWRVTCDVRRLFAEMNYLALDLATAEDMVRLDSDILKTVQARGERGVATATDVLSASRRHFQMQGDLDETRYRVKVAQRGLAALLNVSPETLHVGTNRTVFASLPKEAMPLDRAEGIAMQYRGDVAALRWRLLAAKAAYREARNVRLPWIKEINASYRSTREHTWGSDTTTGSGYDSSASTRSTTRSGQSQSTKTSADGGSESTSETFSEQEWTAGQGDSRSTEYGVTDSFDRQDSEEWWVGFAIDVPIFSWVKNHEDDVLLAESKLAAVQETEGMRWVVNELRVALDEVDECRRQQARYDNDVAPVIAEMRRTLATLKGVPDAMPDQVAATELQIVESARLDSGARWRYRLALLNLERALGAPLADFLPEPER